MVLLAIVCSAVAFSIMIALVGEVGPVRATTVTYVNPAVALVAGAVVLGEPISGWSVAGFAFILTGCCLVAVRRPVRVRVGVRGMSIAGFTRHSSLRADRLAPVAENQARQDSTV
jgi:drug/metabolite transporter (DMT)-like permease